VHSGPSRLAATGLLRCLHVVFPSLGIVTSANSIESPTRLFFNSRPFPSTQPPSRVFDKIDGSQQMLLHWFSFPLCLNRLRSRTGTNTTYNSAFTHPDTTKSAHCAADKSTTSPCRLRPQAIDSLEWLPVETTRISSCKGRLLVNNSISHPLRERCFDRAMEGQSTTMWSIAPCSVEQSIR